MESGRPLQGIQDSQTQPPTESSKAQSSGVTMSTVSQSSQISINPLEEIINSDPKNKACADCKEEPTTVVSINQGVALCNKCATLHTVLGNGISFLHPMNFEWDTYLIEFFKKGGNSKFIEFCEKNGISELPVDQKYKTKAADYYRRNLKAVILGLGEITKDYENGKEIVENPKNAFPEFMNYLLPSQISMQVEPQKGKFSSWFKRVGDSIANGAKKLNNKLKSTKFGQTLTQASEKAETQLKKAGTFIVEKTEPLKDKLKHGTNIIGEHVKGAYDGLKNKIAKNNKDQLKEGEEKEKNTEYAKIDININNPEGEGEEKPKPKEEEKETPKTDTPAQI